MSAAARWDLLCRVVDNFGDAAILWRLARQLAREHRLSVRLFIDRPEVLSRLVPGASDGARIDGVAIHRLPDGAEDVPEDERGDERRDGDRGHVGGEIARIGHDADVVVVGFHARLPPVTRRDAAAAGALHVHFEYLSAESWVQGCHGLPSPAADGLVEHYFYPGFSDATGGLLREADLLERRDAFEADPAAAPRFLASLGVCREPGAVLGSLLCYAQAPLESLADQLRNRDTVLQLIAPGAPGDPGRWRTDASGLDRRSAGRLRLINVPFLSQDDYDTLLWSCDLNFVRGEDSWIRALWAGRPFVWQIYPQDDAAHRPKLEAFLTHLGDDDAATRLAAATRWWNGVNGVNGVNGAGGAGGADGPAGRAPIPALLEGLAGARQVARRLCADLSSQEAGAGSSSDLASRLVGFVEARRQRPPSGAASDKLYSPALQSQGNSR